MSPDGRRRVGPWQGKRPTTALLQGGSALGGATLGREDMQTPSSRKHIYIGVWRIARASSGGSCCARACARACMDACVGGRRLILHVCTHASRKARGLVENALLMMPAACARATRSGGACAAAVNSPRTDGRAKRYKRLALSVFVTPSLLQATSAFVFPTHVRSCAIGHIQRMKNGGLPNARVGGAQGCVMSGRLRRRAEGVWARASYPS